MSSTDDTHESLDHERSAQVSRRDGAHNNAASAASAGVGVSDRSSAPDADGRVRLASITTGSSSDILPKLEAIVKLFPDSMQPKSSLPPSARIKVVTTAVDELALAVDADDASVRLDWPDSVITAIYSIQALSIDILSGGNVWDLPSCASRARVQRRLGDVLDEALALVPLDKQRGRVIDPVAQLAAWVGAECDAGRPVSLAAACASSALWGPATFPSSFLSHKSDVDRLLDIVNLDRFGANIVLQLETERKESDGNKAQPRVWICIQDAARPLRTAHDVAAYTYSEFEEYRILSDNLEAASAAFYREGGEIGEERIAEAVRIIQLVVELEMNEVAQQVRRDGRKPRTARDLQTQVALEKKSETLITLLTRIINHGADEIEDAEYLCKSVISIHGDILAAGWAVVPVLHDALAHAIQYMTSPAQIIGLLADYNKCATAKRGRHATFAAAQAAADSPFWPIEVRHDLLLNPKLFIA